VMATERATLHAARKQLEAERQQLHDASRSVRAAAGASLPAQAAMATAATPLPVAPPMT
jgi:hypothetical protein